MTDADLILAVAELVNKVRNNVFHGVKVYDDSDDRRGLNARESDPGPDR